MREALSRVPSWLWLLALSVVSSNAGSKALLAQTTDPASAPGAVEGILQWIETGGVVALLVGAVVYLWREHRATQDKADKTAHRLLKSSVGEASASAERDALKVQLAEKSIQLEALAHENRTLTEQLLSVDSEKVKPS